MTVRLHIVKLFQTRMKFNTVVRHKQKTNPKPQKEFKSVRMFQVKFTQ